MSGSAMQSSPDKDDDTRGKSMQPHQSAWLAHWKHTKAKPADVAKNHLPIRSECSISQPAAIETSSSNLQRLRNQTFDGHSFHMSRVSVGGETSLDPKHGESSSNQWSKLGPSTGYDALCSITENCSFARPHSVAETQARRPRYQLEDVTWTPEGHSLAVPTPYQVHNVVPHKFNHGRTTMQTVFDRQDDLNQPDAISMVHVMNTNNNAGLLNDSIQANRLVGQQFLNMESPSDAESFPSFITQYGLPRMPFSPSNLETMRIRTTIDSVEGSSRGPPKSQTTHQFFFTKQTEGGQTFRETATYTKFKGKAVNEESSFPPDFGFHVKQGVKLQPLDSSADIDPIRTSALGSGNDSSAETDTMDMNAFHENRISGTASAPSNKDVSRVGKSPAFDAALPSAREEAKDGLLKPELPDINQVLPGLLQSAEDTAYGKETSTSRTLSLGVDHFLSYGKQTMESRSSPRPKIPSGVDPYRRWVKRLKPNASSDTLVHGTKNSKMEETLPHEKVNKLFGKILERRRTGPEPTTIKTRAREHAMRDQSTGSIRNAAVPVRKSQDMARSHFWIQRWCHNLSASSKGKPEVVCEQPQSLKETPPSKQCPSIAAMALMGKAMNGFRPCTFRKRGSSVVWNTNEGLSRGIDAGK